MEMRLEMNKPDDMKPWEFWQMAWHSDHASCHACCRARTEAFSKAKRGQGSLKTLLKRQLRFEAQIQKLHRREAPVASSFEALRDRGQEADGRAVWILTWFAHKTNQRPPASQVGSE